MRTYMNERLVQRNGVASKVILFTGMAALIASFIFSLARPENVTQLLILALMGTFLSQVGMALYNRWGRRPRIDEVLDFTLKGLDNRFAIFHYTLGANHTLICPAGIITLIPRTDEGQIDYEDGKWWQEKKGRGLFRRSGRRVIGRIEENALASKNALARKLTRLLPQHSQISIFPILVFLHETAFVKAEGAAVLGVHAKKLKTALRRLPKGKSIDSDEIELLADSLGTRP